MMILSLEAHFRVMEVFKRNKNRITKLLDIDVIVLQFKTLNQDQSITG